LSHNSIVGEVIRRISEPQGKPLQPFEVAGIIKVLTNKSKKIASWLIPNMEELFLFAQQCFLQQASRDVDGKFKGVHKDIT
jgi:hypothetical protein